MRQPPRGESWLLLLAALQRPLLGSRSTLRGRFKEFPLLQVNAKRESGPGPPPDSRECAGLMKRPSTQLPRSKLREHSRPIVQG